jgi:outer membrane protein assembly factor BamB
MTIRRVLLVAALGALLAGCGGLGHAGNGHPHRLAKADRPHPKPKRRRTRAHSGPVTKLVVTILDGDRRVRVHGARVRLWGRWGRTGPHGSTVIRGPQRRLEVSVSAPGYTPARFRVNFWRRRRQTLRIYQPDLQWPLYGATPARTEAQIHIRLRPPFRLVWSRGVRGLIEFPAVVSDGTAYIGNFSADVGAISMRTGRFDWHHFTPGGGRMASSPAVNGNVVVYHTMGDGRVWVLRRTNGHLLWSWRVGSAIESSPIIVGRVDYFGAANGELYALDLRTRRLRWSRSLGAKITSSAAIDHGTLYIGDYAGRLWALSARTGKTRWVGQVNGKIYGTPAVSNGRVFVPSSTGNSMSAFTTKGHFLWRDTTGNYVYSSPAVWGGRVCYGSYDGWFYGVSAATGRVHWRAYTGGPVSGAAVIVDGVAYAGSVSHRIVGVDVRTGHRVVTFRHGEFVPVSGNGMRLLMYGFNRIYAVEPRRHHHRRRR